MSRCAGVARRLLQGAWQSGPCIAGQPIVATHPELLLDGEIWPGVNASEFVTRRERLASSLPAGGLAIVPAAEKVCMSGAIPYTYRQDSDFLYLTGINQQAIAVIHNSLPQCQSTFTLYLPNSTAQDEVWNGASMSPGAAADIFGADEVLPLSEMAHHLGRIVTNCDSVFYDSGEQRSMQPCHAAPLLSVLQPALQQQRVQPLGPLLHAMRWRKSSAELGLMRQSARLAARGLRKCMQLSQPGVQEHLLAAAFEFECKAGGAQRLAYPPVVAGGGSACTIHYLRNDKRVGAGELVLMDAGCELHGYASDVTRTWPVSGAFSKHQRALYEVVLDAHRRCVEECRVGRTLRRVHALSVELLADGLAQLGLFPGLDAAAIAHGAYRAVYPHNVGHWIGMDTHDTRTVSHDQPMREGVVVTVEPGLYIPNEPAAFGPFAGIGVRIEDDVAVTAGAPEVLSGDVPVAAAEIERLVGAGPGA